MGLKKYDSDGNRNFDEDEIMNIINTLEELYAGEKEVMASIKRRR